MKTELIQKEAIVGLNVVLNSSDTFAIANMRDKLQTALDEHKAVEEYNKLPYDQRKDFERPTEKTFNELPELVQKIVYLLNKLSINIPKSDIFSEFPTKCDEPSMDEPSHVDFDEE